MQKKIILLFLSALLICSALPVTVFAVSEGKCGDSLFWSFDSETGTLTISGSGDMYDYGSGNEPRRTPWYDYEEKIKHINIGEGVTSVGDFAFRGVYFETVDFPDTLVRIGEHSFSSSGAVSVTIPAGVETIEAYAFLSCDRLSSVYFETGRLKTIGDSAFSSCTRLESIRLPQSDVSLGKQSFEMTGLKELHIPGEITHISAGAFRQCKSLASVTLEDGVAVIGDSAFSGCISLSSVAFPETLLSVGDSAFGLCSSLESVRLPDSLIEIGRHAFSASGVKDVIFGRNIEKIGAFAFYSTPLNAVFLPPSAVYTEQAFDNSADSIITIYGVPGSMAEVTGGKNFIPLDLPAAEKTGLTEITLVSRDGLEYSTDGESWQSSPVFSGLKPDTEYTFYQRYAATEAADASPRTTPSVIKTNAGESAGEDYWEYDPASETLTVCGNIYLCDYTSDYRAQDWSDLKNKIKKLEIINAEGKIGSFAFSKLTSLEEVSLCEGITAVGDGAFENSVSLAGISLPQTVTEVGNYAFCNSGLKGALDLSGVSVIGDGAFMNTQLNEARFSENTVYLGFGAFEGAGLQKALFSGNAEFIAKTAFGNNARTVIYCGKGADAEKYAAGNGMECRYFGDLDSDGLFTAADLLLLKRILLNGEAVSDPTASDANADGSVNMLDLVRLKKLAAEI